MGVSENTEQEVGGLCKFGVTGFDNRLAVGREREDLSRVGRSLAQLSSSVNPENNADSGNLGR